MKKMFKIGIKRGVDFMNEKNAEEFSFKELKDGLIAGEYNVKRKFWNTFWSYDNINDVIIVNDMKGVKSSEVGDLSILFIAEQVCENDWIKC